MSLNLAGLWQTHWERANVAELEKASDNDKYVALERATFFANAWGSELVVIANRGHLNGDAGYGSWPKGKATFDAFIAKVTNDS